MTLVPPRPPPVSPPYPPLGWSGGTLLSALGGPRTFPRKLLYTSLRGGGFGLPRLLARFELRFVGSMVAALNSRNNLARQTLRALVGAPALVGIEGNDVAEFLSLLSSHDLAVSLPPHLRTRPAPRIDHICRAYTGGPVCVLSDGSVNGDAVGWGAVVITPDAVLATTSGGLRADCPSSWAAEWIGKLEGVLLAERLGVPRDALR